MAAVIRLAVLFAVLWLIREVRPDKQEAKVDDSTTQSPKDDKNNNDFFFSDNANVFDNSHNPSRGRNVPKTAWSHEDMGADNQTDFTTQAMESKQDELSFFHVSKLFKYLLSFVYNMDDEEKIALAEALENPGETDAIDELNKKISINYVKHPSKRYRKLRNTRKRSGCTKVNGTKCNKPEEYEDMESNHVIREGNDYKNFRIGNNRDTPFDDETVSNEFFDDDREYGDNFQNSFRKDKISYSGNVADKGKLHSETNNKPQEEKQIASSPLLKSENGMDEENSSPDTLKPTVYKDLEVNEQQDSDDPSPAINDSKTITQAYNENPNDSPFTSSPDGMKKEESPNDVPDQFDKKSFTSSPEVMKEEKGPNDGPTQFHKESFTSSPDSMKKEESPNDAPSQFDKEPFIYSPEDKEKEESPNDVPDQFDKKSFTSSPEVMKEEKGPNDGPTQFHKESFTSSPDSMKKEESPNDASSQFDKEPFTYSPEDKEKEESPKDPAQFDEDSFTSFPDVMEKERSPNEAPSQSNKAITASSPNAVKEDENQNDNPSQMPKDIILSYPGHIETDENPNADRDRLGKDNVATSPNEMEENENPKDSSSHLDTQTTASSVNDVQGDGNPDDATLQLDKEISTASSADVNKDENSNYITSPVAEENSTPFTGDVKREENPNDTDSQVGTSSPSHLEKNEQHKSSRSNDPGKEPNADGTLVYSVYPGDGSSNQFTEENYPALSSILTTTMESGSSQHAEDNPFQDNKKQSVLGTTEASYNLNNFRNSNEETSDFPILPENDGVSDGRYKTFVENGTTKQEKYSTPSTTVSQRNVSLGENEDVLKNDGEKPSTQSELPEETQLIKYSDNSDCEDEDFEDLSTDEYQDDYSLSDYSDEYSGESVQRLELQPSYDYHSEGRGIILGSKHAEQTDNTDYDPESKTDMPLAASPSNSTNIQDYYKPEHTFNTILEYIYKYTNNALFKSLKEHPNSTFMQ